MEEQSNNHEEHMRLHKQWAKSFLEIPIWINRPETFLGRIVFKLFRYPAPVYRTLLDVQKELNERMNDCVGLNKALFGPPPKGLASAVGFR